MPDWKRLIREHLRDLELDAPCVEEIVAEIGDHLEEAFSELRRCGMPEEEAFRRALDEIPNWNRFRGHLRRAVMKEVAMTQRTKSLWIPGLAMTAVSLVGLIGAFRANMYPEGLSITSDYALLIYVPWLASLPLIGALGAYWSRQSGADSATRLRACLIPVVVLTGMFLTSTPVRIFWIFRSVLSFGRQVSYLTSCSLFWAVYPSLLLILGALPFLRGKARQNTRLIQFEN